MFENETIAVENKRLWLWMSKASYTVGRTDSIGEMERKVHISHQIHFINC